MPITRAKPSGIPNYTVATSATLPSFPAEGDMAYTTDTNMMYTWDGNAWVNTMKIDGWYDFAPTLTAGVTITKTMTYARYMRMGRLVIANCYLAITAVGTAGNPVLVGLPYQAAGTNMIIGSFWYQDSGTAIYSGAAQTASALTVGGAAYNSVAFMGQSAPSLTTASGDFVGYSVMYEAAAAP